MRWPYGPCPTNDERLAALRILEHCNTACQYTRATIVIDWLHFEGLTPAQELSDRRLLYVTYEHLVG